MTVSLAVSEISSVRSYLGNLCWESLKVIENGAVSVGRIRLTIGLPLYVSCTIFEIFDF